MAIIADIQAGHRPKGSSQQRTSTNEDSNNVAAVLTEDMVTDSLENHLVRNGWKIISRAKGKARGVDVVAERHGVRIEIEAKGAGSGDPTTKNYGHEFTRGNVFTHVGEAVLKALRVITTALKISGLWGLVSGFPGLVTVWLHVGRGGVTGCGGP